ADETRVAGDTESAPPPRWCDLPLVRPSIPQVQSTALTIRSDLDRIWLHRLQTMGLAPAPPASEVELVRRLHYTLTGLPPSPEQVEDYLADDRPDRWQKLIDRLLQDEQFGVHWARHWLDLVRWAETDSYERDRLKPGAWRYRDWVIDSLNADMPYPQFVTMQLAGDELADETIDHHIATGFLHLGIRDDEPADPLQAVYDDLDGMLDTTCRTMLGISIGCARCHDHKGDPIPTRDYYRLLTFFEGLKPYKNGGGNGISTNNFVRTLPVDLGRSDYHSSVQQWKTERSERLAEVDNLLTEVEERWGEEVLQQARSTLWRGQRLHLPFSGEEIALKEDRDSSRGPGRHGEGLVLDENDRLLIDRPVQDDFSISLWFRTDHPGAGGNTDLRWFRGTGLVDGEIGGVVNDFGISLVGDHVCAGTGKPEVFIHGPQGMADGQWHHVVFTRNRESGEIVLWVDGSRVSSGSGGKQSLDSAEQLSIGRMLPDHQTLQGSLDEIRFWDRVLDANEILDLSIGGGALPAHQQLVEERLGIAEALRLKAAVTRLGQLSPPTREEAQVLSAQELPTPPPGHIRVRGTASVKGEAVTPGFPQILGGQEATIVRPADGQSSGRRLALANWITSPENPRTSRVLANRIWQHVFGRAIVESPNDFGKLGLLPHDQQLLDLFAAEIEAHQWSIKSAIRLLVTSTMFRMSNQFDEESNRVDPENNHLWRFRSRRLSAEEIRDSVLSVNGSLNRSLGGPGVYPPMPEEVLATASRPDQAWGQSSPEDAARRSLFIHVKRSLLHPLLLAFDMADTDSPC
ncbi:MAG: DUF1549 domain-containing protein, partial [Planctomycetota bacterium]|nr:DUF1549 domain-containing protein [Planctomycetota bacterium]